MAVEMDTATAITVKHGTSDKPGDNFIPLSGAEDFISLAASDAEDSEDDEEDEDASTSFHPHRITLSTFRRLLACYPTTVEQVYRRKMMVKMQPKPEKGSKAKAIKKGGSSSANARGAALIQKTDFNPSEERYINSETEKFLTLDRWRYEVFPKVLKERREGKKEESDEKEGGWCLDKDELVSVMDWKMKHGLPRPTLMGLIKSNQVNFIRKSTAAALTALPTADFMLSPNNAFPKPSLDALITLRGVGPATASLILSIATAAGDAAHQVPFYSDDLYLWLCLKDFPQPDSAHNPKTLISRVSVSAARPTPKKVSKYKKPNGELNVKYNLHEYRQLWNASQELRQKLNLEVETAGEDGPPVSHIDIERVAFVLRYIAVSGYYPDQDPETILQAKAEIQPDTSAGAAASEKSEKGQKRKRKDKHDEQLTKKKKRKLEKKGIDPSEIVPVKRKKNKDKYNKNKKGSRNSKKM